MMLINYNSLILVIYLYVSTIVVLLTPISSNELLRFFAVSLLLLITLIINKFRITKKNLLIFLFLVIIIAVNSIMVSHKNYVFSDGFNFLLYSSIPIYLLGSTNFNFNLFILYWRKSSIIFSLLIPLLFLYNSIGIASYYDLAFTLYLNSLILSHNFIFHKKSKSGLMLLIFNMIVLVFFGSRMVFFATFITIILAYLFSKDKKKLGFYFSLSLISAISLYIYNNLLNILIQFNSILASHNINSRNLFLFITQLKSSSDQTVILSGRDEIYPVVLEYISQHPLMPSGLGMGRVLTGGKYYHSHNFLLEISLIFGVVLASIILLLIVILIIKNIKNIKKYYNLSLFLMLLVSFAIRSLTGTHFVNDVIFMILFSILCFPKGKQTKI